MLSAHFFHIHSTLFFAFSLSFASTNMTSMLSCLCCVIPAHICLQMLSEIPVLVTLLDHGGMFPAAVPCLPACFWEPLWQMLSSIPCMQAGGPHQGGWTGAAEEAQSAKRPHSQAWFVGGSPPRVAWGEQGSLPTEQCPHSVPTSSSVSHQQPGTEYLPCWPHSSSAEEAAEKMQLQQTTATRASAAIHTWH